jgi:hypothetical protein
MPNNAIAAAAASIPVDTIVILPSEVAFAAPPVDEAFAAPSALSDFPMVIGKPDWPIHIVLKKSAMVFWSAGLLQALGSLVFAAVMIPLFLHIHAESVSVV